MLRFKSTQGGRGVSVLTNIVIFCQHSLSLYNGGGEFAPYTMGGGNLPTPVIFKLANFLICLGLKGCCKLFGSLIYFSRHLAVVICAISNLD